MKEKDFTVSAMVPFTLFTSKHLLVLVFVPDHLFFLLAWRNGSEGQRFDHEGVPVRLQSSPHHHRPARMYNKEPLFDLCWFSPLVTCFNATKYASKLDSIQFIPLLMSLQLQCYNLQRENQFLVVLLLPKVPSPPICCVSEGLIVPW